MWRNKNKIDSRISDLELQIKDLNNLNDILAKEYYGMKNVVMKRDRKSTRLNSSH